MVRVKGRRKTAMELLEIEAFIREGILEARFVPGQRLVEIDLMNEFSVTRFRDPRGAAPRGSRRARAHRAQPWRFGAQDYAQGSERHPRYLDDLSIFAIRKAIARVRDPRIRKLIEQSRAASKRFRKDPRSTRRRRTTSTRTRASGSR